ncbi:unnamed protein product, partial [Ectocarpus sp. 6 AP-2014]
APLLCSVSSPARVYRRRYPSEPKLHCHNEAVTVRDKKKLVLLLTCSRPATDSYKSTQRVPHTAHVQLHTPVVVSSEAATLIATIHSGSRRTHASTRANCNNTQDAPIKLCASRPGRLSTSPRVRQKIPHRSRINHTLLATPNSASIVAADRMVSAP